MKRSLVFILIFFSLHFSISQTIREVYHNVNNGTPSASVNTPGTIVYPVGYQAYNVKTPVIFVHGFTGKLTGSYEANIADVISGHLNAAFVQLEPMGTTEENGMLLKKMIDRIASHFGAATVSIVAHSKGGMDTERALYGKNPYNPSIPSFGYEKVDGVYTFGSPLKGSRVADIGAALSWTGIAWIAMWYTNAFSLTSASVQDFHNWASSWRINSNGTFRNYYHPSGASYSRINLIEDNTTRWWAHQSDDPCYGGRWYFCYVGDYFHRTIGAYYDAEWVWDGWNSGFRNWHPENDGFIAVYRAQRNVITNNYPALTPGAGDYNYITMHDADHISLWDPGEGHFAREVKYYLHYGLYDTYSARPQSQPADEKPHQENPPAPEKENIYLSSGQIYPAFGGKAQVLIENDDAPCILWIYSPSPVLRISLTNGQSHYEATAPFKTEYQSLAGAYVSYFEINGLSQGIYLLETDNGDDALAGMLHLAPQTSFAVKWNWDENWGYTGNPIEVKIGGMDKEALENVHVYAELSRLSLNGKALPVEKIRKTLIEGKLINPETGLFRISLPDLKSGEHYAISVKAEKTEGTELLSRNATTTFYVYENLPVKEISIAKAVPEKEIKTESGLWIYPNPARDYFKVNTGGSGVLTIKDLSGKVLKTTACEGETTIPVNDLKKGAYLLEWNDGETIRFGKLIVQ